MASTHLRPTRRLHGAYVAAHYGKSLFWYATELLFAFFLAEVYGLEPTAIGTLLFIFLVWDAITDPVIGVVLAGRRVTTGDLMRLQLAGAVFSAMAFVAIFARPNVPSDALLAYAAVVGLVFRTAYTIYDVPQNTLLARLGHNDQARLRLSSLRAAFSAIAALTLSLATFLILGDSDDGRRALPFVIMAVTFVSVALVSSIILWRIGREQKDIPAEPPSAPVLAEITSTLSHPGVARCLAAVFILSIGWPLFGKLLPFYATYVHESGKSAGYLIAAIAIGAALSQPIWIFLGRHFGRTTLLTIAMCGVLSAGLLFSLLSMGSTVSAAVSTGLLSAFVSAMGMIVWARLADQFDHSKADHGNDLLAFGALTFASKLALGVSGFGLGVALDTIEYQSGVPLSVDSRVSLSMIMAAAPAASAALAWSVMIIGFSAKPVVEASSASPVVR